MELFNLRKDINDIDKQIMDLLINRLEVVEKVKEISGNNFNVINKSRRAGDPEFLVANSDLCKKILNWVPKYDTLDVIIKDSLDWENKIK